MSSAAGVQQRAGYTDQSGGYVPQNQGPYQAAQQNYGPYTDQSGGYVPQNQRSYQPAQQSYGPYVNQEQAVGPNEYVDKHGQVRRRKLRGGRFAACLACCWCLTWPCHGPCCGGL